MKKTLAFFLVALTLVAGAAFVACGGGDDDKENGDKTTPVAEETKETDGEDTPEEKDTPAAKETKEDDGGDSGGSLDNVPIYPGADEVMTGEWSGDEALIPAIGDGENPADFEKVKYGIYETDDSPDDVFEWYKDKMSGWKEEWVFATSGEEGAGGIGVWSKDDGKTAAWIMVGEDSGKTSLTVMTGSQ